MNRLAPTVLTLGLALASPAAAALAPCAGAVTVRPEAKPKAGGVQGWHRAPPVAGCLFGARLNAGGGVTLWRCVVDRGDEPARADDWSNAFLVVREGGKPQAFEDDLMAGELSAFHLVKADLDGDGKAENVVAAWNATGNGLGVNIWTVRIFSADWRLLETREEVADWGPASVVRAPPGRGGCDVAVTAFVDVEKPKPGIAYEARFLRLSQGRVAEAKDRPPVRRRYTFAFQRERNAWFNARQARADGGGYEGNVPGWLAPR